MIRTTRFLTAAFFVALFCMPASMASGQQWAREMFEKVEHDFGSVKREDRPVYEFVFSNKYVEDMRVRSVYSSCGCTTVSIDKRVLRSGEQASIRCEFNSHLFTGFKQATITVEFDHPFRGASVQLNVKGTIITGVTTVPETIDFGQVSRTNLIERSVRITRTNNPNFRIVDVQSTFGNIGVGLQEAYRGRDAVVYDLTARFRDDVDEGFNQGELIVIAQDNGQQIQIPVPFNGKVVNALQLSPAVLTLSPVQPGEEVIKRVVIKADEPFQLTDVKCVNRSFRVRPTTQGARKIHFVDVIYVGQDLVGRHECDLEFETDGGPALSGIIRAVVDIAPAETQATGTPEVEGRTAGQE
ncbi:MAG: DUF1573 domain-containing protein [Planctomycetota bacterium]